MKYEIAIGLPSYNEAERIGFVVQQVDRGISKFYDSNRAVIVNFDCGSLDKTRESFLNTATKTEKLAFDIGKGKGTALIGFWKFAKNNNIPYIATIDADLFSITPEWVDCLIRPLIDRRADVVLPLYARNRYGANITNHFAYPAILSIFGVKVRQPLAGEFGYSQKFYNYLLKQRKYEATYKYGIDIFITCHALSGGFQIFNPDLKKKIDKPSFYHQEETFLEVCQSALSTINEIVSNKLVKCKKPLTGNKNYCAIDEVESFPHEKDIPVLLKKLTHQFRSNSALNQKYLGKEVEQEIANRVSDKYTNIDEELWALVLSRILIFCFTPTLSLEQIDEASRMLLPIYRWRVINFWLSAKGKPIQEVENTVKHQALLIQEKVNALLRTA